VDVERETDAARAMFATGEMGVGWEEDEGAGPGPAGCEAVGAGVDMARDGEDGACQVAGPT
jgi:hypothetical protein